MATKAELEKIVKDLLTHAEENNILDNLCYRGKFLVAEAKEAAGMEVNYVDDKLRIDLLVPIERKESEDVWDWINDDWEVKVFFRGEEVLIDENSLSVDVY